MNSLQTLTGIAALLASIVTNAATLPIIEGATIERTEGEKITYHVIESQTPGAYTVTLLETDTDIIGIDTGPAALPNFADNLKTYINAINKPFSLVVTHAHRDHFGNVATLAPKAIYAEAHTADALMKHKVFPAMYIDKVVKTEALEFGGLTLSFGNVAHSEKGAGHNGYAYIPATRDLFAGDLAYNNAHSYIREFNPSTEPDELKNWIAGLKQMKREFGGYKRLFVGHGGMSDTVEATIDQNIEYLTFAHQLITGGTAKSPQEVVDALQAKYPDLALGGLKLSLPKAFGKKDPGANWFAK